MTSISLRSHLGSSVHETYSFLYYINRTRSTMKKGKNKETIHQNTLHMAIAYLKINQLLRSYVYKYFTNLVKR